MLLAPQSFTIFLSLIQILTRFSDMDPNHFAFEFPTAISDPSTNPALPNDIVFCGRVMVPQSEPDPPQKAKNPFLLRSDSFAKLNATRSHRFITPTLTEENRCRRSTSCRKKHRNGLFGMLKFPLHMELSEMKMRQGRREPAPLPKFTANGSGDWEIGDDGGKSCWQVMRPLRRQGLLMSALAKATFGLL